MAKKAVSTKGSIYNSRARFDYELGDIFVVGLQLTGGETKSLRFGNGDLRGSYVNLIGNELWLINAKINGTKGIPIVEDQVTRSRKLLAKKSEIEKLVSARQAGNTIVPLELITRGRYIKLKIAVGRGKKQYDKRETLKKRQEQRDIGRELKR